MLKVCEMTPTGSQPVKWDGIEFFWFEDSQTGIPLGLNVAGTLRLEKNQLLQVSVVNRYLLSRTLQVSL